MVFFCWWYISVGASIYIIFFIKDAMSGFTRYDSDDGCSSVMRGIFGALILWPLLVWMMEIEE